MKQNPFFFTCILLFVVSKLYSQTFNYSAGTNAGNSGVGNTAVGYNAGDVITGSTNTFLGSNSGKLCVSCDFNVMLGGSSGISATSASRNVFVGYGAGRGVTGSTASENVAIGYNSSNSLSTGADNITIGANSAPFLSSGSGNILLGFSSGFSSTNATDNLYMGLNTGFQNVSGSKNIFLGRESGYQNLGSSNIFIGYQSGYNETGSNKLYIDNSSTTTPLIYGDFSTNQVGINALPSTHTLNVGGSINATALFVNGQPFSSAGVWTAAPNGVIYTNTANVGMGTTLANNPNGYKLAVNGKIGAKEVQIENTSLTWSDFVFKSDYRLRSLDEVEQYIKQNGHLPEIPSEAEVKEKGIELGEMNAKLLQKIEELTLYVIELKKEVDNLKSQKEK